MSVKYLEKQVMKQCIADLLDAGFQVSVNDGEETTLKRSTDAEAIFAAMRTTDDDYLFVYKPDAPGDGSGEKGCFGWVRFIYGNSGWDVINDYSTNLEQALKRTDALTDEMSE